MNLVFGLLLGIVLTAFSIRWAFENIHQNSDWFDMVLTIVALLMGILMVGCCTVGICS